MRCAQARQAIVERGLGALTPLRSSALERHLAGCAGCRREEVVERQLVRALESLRTPLPREVDVTAQVLSRLSTQTPVRREEISPSQLSWAAAGMMLYAFGLLVALALQLPTFSRVVRETAGIVRALGEAAVRLAAPLARLVAVPFKLLFSLVDSLIQGAAQLEALAPLGVTAASLGYLGMAIVVTYVLRRDFRTQVLHEDS